ncbi:MULTISPECIES: hypothetical protein [unclassified Sphingomonas]|jgi:hypothetical protein|uniref:hypothetical protein n=1 Tax=unclassified Sphingomonas TaxID=196159 RepID=UPI00226AFAD6|nr:MULTISPECIES: hypothetical protein [unclassified Sphingomonas]
MRASILLLPLLALAASGCVAQTAWNVATLPVKATGKAIDWTTTSQSESDRNYGRKMRKQEAEEGKQRRKAAERCKKHPDDQDACQYQGYRAGY